MAKKSVSLTDAAVPVLKAVIEKKTHIPILNFVKVEARGEERIAYATDLDTWAEVRVNDGTEPGLYRIMGKELVPSSADDKESQERNFPETPAFISGETSLVLPLSVLKSSLPFISSEESRYTLGGMLLTAPSNRKSPIVAAATDGHRLRVQYLRVSAGEELPADATDYLVPRKLLEMITKLTKADNVTFTVNAPAKPRLNEDGQQLPEIGQMHFKVSTSAFTLYTRKMTGQFPNWQAVITRGTMENHFGVERAALIEALTTLKPFCDERSGAVSYDWNDESVTLSGKNDGYSKSITLPIVLMVPLDEFDGNKFLKSATYPGLSIVMPMRDDKGKGKIALNRDYILEAAKTLAGEWAYFGIKDGHHAISLSDTDFTKGEQCLGDATATEVATAEIAAD